MYDKIHYKLKNNNKKNNNNKIKIKQIAVSEFHGKHLRVRQIFVFFS